MLFVFGAVTNKYILQLSLYNLSSTATIEEKNPLKQYINQFISGTGDCIACGLYTVFRGFKIAALV